MFLTLTGCLAISKKYLRELITNYKLGMYSIYFVIHVLVFLKRLIF